MGPRSLTSSRAGRISLGLTVLLVAGTALAVALLWPGGGERDELARALAPDRIPAEVVALRKADCINSRFDECRSVTVKLLGGEFPGTETSFKTGETGYVPPLEVGDRVGVYRSRARFEGGVPNRQPYVLGDPERRGTLIWLAFGFAALVFLLGGRQGARSLLGLIGAIATVFLFIVPAILDGEPALAVALAGGMTVMLSTTLFTHGIGPKSLAAILGTAASLALTALLAVGFTDFARLTGFGAENASTLAFSLGPDFSLTGLLLAGIVIATLGVLDDVTVSQASTVMALRRANPLLGARALYREALEVGRDHVSATVNTLVLAYVGASLPALLVFGVGGVGIAPALDLDRVAEQVVGTLVGSIGLLAAMPVTTALSALLAVRLAPAELPEEHVHHHG